MASPGKPLRSPGLHHERQVRADYVPSLYSLESMRREGAHPLRSDRLPRFWVRQSEKQSGAATLGAEVTLGVVSAKPA